MDKYCNVINFNTSKLSGLCIIFKLLSSAVFLFAIMVLSKFKEGEYLMLFLTLVVNHLGAR